ncbi:MAG: hypothetical protein ACTSRZ_21040 [Promethearchaeota archaeon]
MAKNIEKIDKRINKYFFIFEGAINLFLLIYLFIRMGLSVWKFGIPLYAFSFSLVMIFIIGLFVLNDWVFLQNFFKLVFLSI